MKEIYPGIYVIQETSRLKLMKPPMNIYAIPGEQGIVFDAGYGNNRFVKQVTRELQGITSQRGSNNITDLFSKILISHAHPDHFSGLNKINRTTGIPVCLTKKSAQLVSSSKNYKKSYQNMLVKNNNIFDIIKNTSTFIFYLVLHLIYHRLYGMSFISNPDIIIEENSEIEINNEKWRIFPSPGHSEDHISLYNENLGILLAGDNILRSKTSWLGPPKSDLAQYIASMRELQNLPNLKIILSAHGSPIENPRDRIEEIIQWRLKRIEDVYSAIKIHGRAGITFKGLFHSLYPGEGWIKLQIVEGWMKLTLKYLLEQKRIKTSIIRRKTYYLVKR